MAKTASDKGIGAALGDTGRRPAVRRLLDGTGESSSSSSSLSTESAVEAGRLGGAEPLESDFGAGTVGCSR